MNKVQWKSRRTLSFVLGLIIFYLFKRVRNYEHKMVVFLSKVNPIEPWEFVADFSNMKYLNPTITDFLIIEESGNYDHWKYTAEYSEKLSHWPHMSNSAVAHFQVKTSPKKDVYYVNSVHRTLDSESEFKFSISNHTKGTICEETVFYQCPSILSSFCRREVIFQRNAIVHNLKKKFSR